MHFIPEEAAKRERVGAEVVERERVGAKVVERDSVGAKVVKLKSVGEKVLERGKRSRYGWVGGYACALDCRFDSRRNGV